MSAPGRDEIARFLRQRIEAGMPALVLDGLDRATVASLVAAAVRTGGEAARGAAGGAAAGRASGRAGAAGSVPGRADAPVRADAPARADAPGRAGARQTANAPAGAADTARAGASGGRGEPGRAARPGAEAGPVTGLDYGSLRDAALACTRCALAAGRTTVVFSDGNPDARVMVVGEAPGANEDRTGLPFVGAAGKLLDLMLASVDLSRKDSVYICNVLKCRPPGNRNPLPEEIEACAPYLRRQIELVRPEVILAVGTFAARLLTGSQDALGKLRGSVYSYEGVPLVVTYHPAALLRNPGWRRPTWDDLQLLRSVLDAA